MRIGLSLSLGTPRFQLPAIVVGSAATNAGSSTSLSNILPDDDIIIVARRASVTPSGPPSGNPHNWTTVATSRGAGTSARIFHVRATSAMLTDGVYATGTTNPAATRVHAVPLRYVTSLTAGAATDIQAATTTRPFSAISGLTARGIVVGYAYLSTGTAPVPSGVTFPTNGDQGASGRLWVAGPTSTWAPAAAADGSSVDWLELAVGAI